MRNVSVKLLDVVALLVDKPADGLVSGDAAPLEGKLTASPPLAAEPETNFGNRS